MNGANRTRLLELAARHPGPVADAVKRATKDGRVDGTKLRKALEDAGLDVKVGKAGKGRVTVEAVDDDGNRVAYANATDEAEAALHAVLGYLREQEAAAPRRRTNG